LFSIFFALIGVLGELYSVPEWAMFAGFVIIFGIYFALFKFIQQSQT